MQATSTAESLGACASCCTGPTRAGSCPNSRGRQTTEAGNYTNTTITVPGFGAVTRYLSGQGLWRTRARLSSSCPEEYVIVIGATSGWPEMSLSTFNTVRRGGSSEEPGDRERYRELWRSTTKEVALHRFAEELTLFIESHQLSAVSLLFLLIAESLIHKRSV